MQVTQPPAKQPEDKETTTKIQRARDCDFLLAIFILNNHKGNALALDCAPWCLLRPGDQ
jgi:hypothetical protein